MEKKLVCIQAQSGKWGAIDKDGNLAVPMKYADCKIIDDNAYFKLKKNDEVTSIKVNLIEGTQEEWQYQWNSPDPSKWIIVPENSTTVGERWYGNYKVLKDGKYAIWRHGNYITDFEYDNVGGISIVPDYFYVKKGEHFGVVNIEGKTVVPIEFCRISRSEGSDTGYSTEVMWFCYNSDEEDSHFDKIYNDRGEDITYSVWAPELDNYDDFEKLNRVPGFTSHYAVKKDDLWGIFDIKERKEIIPCKYNHFISPYGTTYGGCYEEYYFGLPQLGFLTCERAGLYGVYDPEGNVVFDCKYKEITNVEEGAAVATDEGCYIYDEHYNLIEKNIEKYDESSSYHEGFKTCKKDGVEYVRDKEGNRYIEGKYDIRDLNADSQGYVETQIEGMLDTEHFSHGLMPVCKDYLYGYIDTSFNEVIPLQYSFASNFNDEGFACVKCSDLFTDRKGPWALIDTRGNIIVKWPGDQFRYDMETGLIRVHSEEKRWGIIDTKGNEIVMYEMQALVDRPEKWDYSEDVYKYYDPYSDWLVLVKKGQEPIVIDSESSEIIYNYMGPGFFETEYSYCHRYPVTVADGRWVVVDDKMNIVIPEHYDDMLNFSSDMLAVKQNDLWGYIDIDGRVIVPCQYEQASDMSHGHAGVMQNGKWGLIDKTGRLVVPCEYAEIHWAMADEWGCVFAKKGRKLIRIEL